MAEEKPAKKPAPPVVDCGFPGGNIVVKGIEGEKVLVRQDLRDTKGWWFYWYFRVRGAAGRTLTFSFDRGPSFAALGPAVSVDGGANWSWLGKQSVTGNAFRYTFPANAADVRFSMGMPYVRSDLQAFLKPHRRNPHLKVEMHCKTRKGRPVERIRVGRVDGKCKYRVLLTARHHACEMMASYVLEGVIAAFLGGEGVWLRENVELLAVPLMDTDGVEDGDQGKNRKPHDHNRDYKPKSIYPAVRANREFAGTWSGGRLRVAIDLHCPYIRGGRDHHIFLVGGPSKEHWKRTLEFGQVLKSVQTGPLRYTGKHDVPQGVGWNKTAVGPCGKWMATLPGVRVAGTIEVPYASASGQPVTAASARLFGRSLARAVGKYLQTPHPLPAARSRRRGDDTGTP